MPHLCSRILPVLLALAAALTACGDGGPAGPGASTGDRPADGTPTVTIGTRISAEQLVLGQLWKQALEAQGFTLELKQNIVTAAVAERALRRGEIDLYPGTGAEPAGNTTQLAPAPFAAGDALVVTPALAKAHGLEGIADLRRLETVRLGGRPEFLGDEDGLARLAELYGVSAVRFAPLTRGLQYDLLDEGRLDAALVSRTDGVLHEGSYVVLDDPLGLFEVHQLMPVVRATLLAVQPPAFQDTLDAVDAVLTLDAMRKLNAAVELEHRTPEDVAREFLEQHDLA